MRVAITLLCSVALLTVTPVVVAQDRSAPERPDERPEARAGSDAPARPAPARAHPAPTSEERHRAAPRTPSTPEAQRTRPANAPAPAPRDAGAQQALIVRTRAHIGKIHALYKVAQRLGDERQLAELEALAHRERARYEELLAALPADHAARQRDPADQRAVPTRPAVRPHATRPERAQRPERPRAGRGGRTETGHGASQGRGRSGGRSGAGGSRGGDTGDGGSRGGGRSGDGGSRDG